MTPSELEQGYQEMAQDALAWAEATIGDVADEPEAPSSTEPHMVSITTM